ncbi:hypothetical protein THRCLA_09487 [Thraustotheca clavata]|uniref:Secreted protein n=1 Tax=Thraustotheca clavata TaxID=74557 RepID=A0A1V9YW78_9STRA|nr:hypothetical protein THRCLA_09487 [Thraustotheca clavata]
MIWFGIFILLGVIFYKRLKSSKPVKQYGDSVIQLMSHEAKPIGVFSSPPIQTVTIFSSANIDQVALRTAEIVKLNPWLLGRLIRGPNKTLELHYFKDSISGHNAFTHIHAPLPLTSSWNEITDYLATISLVTTGQKCADQATQYLFQVILVDLPDGKIALCVALNHTIGDGHTFIELYKMLDYRNCPKSLNPTRPFINSKEVFSTCSPYGDKALNSSFVKIRVLYHIWLFFYNKLWFNAQKRAAVYRVSMKYVDAVKANHIPTKDIPFLSTNDIVTSAYFIATKAILGLMQVNLRSRLKLSENNAGNYAISFVYPKEFFLTPCDIRKSMGQWQQFPTLNNECPTFTQAICGERLCLLTNHTSAYHELFLIEGVPPLKHSPLARISFLSFDTMAVLYNHTSQEIRLRVRGDFEPTSELFEQVYE